MDSRASRTCVAAALVLELACAHGGVRRPEVETRALREVHEAYRRAWLASDTEGVMRLFAPDAVLMPHHGLAPVVGAEAIRAFWFAPGPATVITRLDLELDELSVQDATGLVRGRSHVEWTVEKGSTLERWANAGTFLTVLRRGPDGAWRITHHMWDDPPNRRL
ncbi:MAG: SgcJ/EcaC family oxidoreductase [Myxococcaceae bacterium]|nr:MAG: SgcJ/EcaC family oxidoreductase [Myxococcaceae bacterium]